MKLPLAIQRCCSASRLGAKHPTPKLTQRWKSGFWLFVMRLLRIFSEPQDHEPSCIICLATLSFNSEQRPFPDPHAPSGRSFGRTIVSLRKSLINSNRSSAQNLLKKFKWTSKVFQAFQPTRQGSNNMWLRSSISSTPVLLSCSMLKSALSFMRKPFWKRCSAFYRRTAARSK